jgi:ribosomal protein L34
LNGYGDNRVRTFIYSILYTHIEKNNILVSEQHGFRAQTATSILYTHIGKNNILVNEQHGFRAQTATSILYTHIEKNNILVSEQHGFRTQTATVQASYILINQILTAMNNSLVVGGIFCDLQKVFDCVNH